jgi:hypothetical protein
MHLVLLFLTLSHAAEPAFCRQDLSRIQLSRPGMWMPPEHLVERALQPAMARSQEDICRCLPRRSRRWPSEIRVQVHAAPNQGKATMSYLIAPPWSRAKSQLVACLGEPTVNFEPFRYLSDVMTEDGLEEASFRYPLVVELERTRSSKDNP